MSARSTRAPGAQQKRLVAYLDSLAQAAGHADRIVPFKAYRTGLLLPGERKSIEPMAARLDPDHVGRMHQSLHHLVAEAPWDDEVLLDRALDTVLPSMRRQSPIVAWVVDDTGFPKKGQHSVGVTRQYCGQVGKQDNCRVAVSLSVTTENSSMPVAFRLYLPEVWARDKERRSKGGVPEEVAFQTKPQIALDQIKRARERGVPTGVVLADAGYGNAAKFREQLTEWQLSYVAGIQSTVTVWKPGEQPKPAPKGKGMGRPPKLLQRDPEHQPVTVKDLALSLPEDAWKNISWRQGVGKKLASRFAALRVRPAHRDYWRAEPHLEEWLPIEWPKDENEPIKYWFSTLPANTSLKDLVHRAKHRWIIERDYEELKQELGLGHFEGRGWRGFHHHATLCIAAYGFLVSERSRFSPQSRPAILDYAPPGRQKASGQEARHVRPERHNPHSIATIRRVIARYLLRQLPYCPCCGFRSGSSSASTSASAIQDAGREWFGAVCHAPSSSSTPLSLSSAMQRQLSGDPGGFRPLRLAPPN